MDAGHGGFDNTHHRTVIELDLLGQILHVKRPEERQFDFYAISAIHSDGDIVSLQLEKALPPGEHECEIRNGILDENLPEFLSGSTSFAVTLSEANAGDVVQINCCAREFSFGSGAWLAVRRT